VLKFLASAWLKIVSGNITAGIARLAALAIAARSLEISTFSLLVLVEAYIRVVDGLLNFQSVHVLTRYLAESQKSSDAQRFRGFVKAGLLIDSTTALVSAAIAILLLPAIHSSIGIPRDWLPLAAAYCLVIVTRVLGTAEAVLRSLDSFWSIGLRDTASGLLLVSASVAAWFGGGGAWVFLLVWAGSEALANIGFVAWTLIVLRRHGIRDIRHASALSTIRSASGFWAALWQTNLTFGVRILSQHGDLLVAGAVLGPEAPGLLRAAKNISSLLSQFGRPLQQVSSAQIARLTADRRGAELLRYTARICTVAATGGLVVTAAFLFFGRIPLELAFGSAYAPAAGLLVIFLLGESVYLAGITLLPTTIALGLSAQFLRAILVATVGFAIALGVGLSALGLSAIAWAHFVFHSVWLIYGWRCVTLRAHSLN
jgi:O-antigen/teichoic acid export membrane protein